MNHFSALKKTVYIFLFTLGFWILNSGFCSAQTIDSAEYFFDADPGTGNGMSISITAGDSLTDSLYVNTNGLNSGFHFVFFRVKDTNNVWSLYEGGLIFIYDTAMTASASIDSSEYFFSADPGVNNGITITIAPGDSTLDTVIVPTTGLLPGFHNLFARVMDTNAVWSLYEGTNFYLYDTIAQSVPASYPIESAEYFYDTDPGVGNGIAIANFSPADSIFLTDTLPSAPLTTGFHSLFLRVRDTMNVWSLYDWQSFVICNFIPVPDFTSDTVCLNNPTTFTDLSTNLDTSANYTYGWDFNNDGITDDTTKGNTSYTFLSSGTQTISLIVNNSNGCVDTVIKTVYVDSLPTVTLNFPVDTFCHDDSILLSGGLPAGGIYSGNGVYGGSFLADSVSNGIHFIAYTYYNSDSCSITVYDTVYVSPCLGINEFSGGNVSVVISPNPFTTETMISIQGYTFKHQSIKLYDIFGRLVLHSKFETRNVKLERGNLMSGVYFYKITSDEKIFATGKLILVD
ncbi:MAG: T9SS type A sorting domain-containing protein [Bacteroidetes bacterium]|nr:T9SS type A sorting domain-containing protein [Bacteroidota bacterium]